MERTIALFALCLLTALPVHGALHKHPPAYGHIVMTVEKHFAKADRDKSGTISEAEYIAISHTLKGQAEKDARLDFYAMDINNDSLVTFDEFYGELPSALTV